MRAVALALAALVIHGCIDKERTTATDAPMRAEFGVFFGGQVQQRREIPFQLDPSRQQHGFRVWLTAPLAKDVKVRWELNKPGKAERVRDEKGRRGHGRITVLGTAHIPSGQTRFEHVMRFKPGDPLGVWNIRVVAGDVVLLDRPFGVYDAAERRRAIRAATDAAL